MGVFDRLGNVIKGAVSARLSNLEKNNPEAVFAAAKEEGIARLKTLEAQGVIATRLYEHHPPRYEYFLTDRGTALGPVLKALRTWGERFG